MVRPIVPTESQLSKFLEDPRLVRAFENLFKGRNKGVFFDTTDQFASEINTPTVVTFDNTQISRGVEIDTKNTSRIIVSEAGTYEFKYTLQLKE